MSSDVAMVWIFAVIVAAGVALVIAGLQHRTKVLELAHRERLAMIERGIAPPAPVERAPHVVVVRDKPVPHRRLLSIGVLVIGFGGALAMIIGFAAGAPGTAAGIGGAIAVIGAAFVVIALVTGHQAGAAPPVDPGSPLSPPTADPGHDSHRPE